jgi:hypothetical protein
MKCIKITGGKRQQGRIKVPAKKCNVKVLVSQAPVAHSCTTRYLRG